ncbi:aldo/keto reductase [Permianibacter sp. IMCC34836]|uniref:aldo/keto reductase n=1 Tax=Permianibacter fluminis TaxID=2738515 RepID=UPI001552CE8B|nr:aldo/keto reductase [Permianibacter fluminis]NQD37500.1 aldo/keto reductase [Permianibacter fluminis]
MTKPGASLPTRRFGRSDFEVSVLGFGAQWIGDPALAERDVANVIAAALDAGITLFDTARLYFASERRLGTLLKPVRQQIILSSKVGYDIPGTEDWSFAAVSRGVDEALRVLQTDYLDVVHLHSCGLQYLQRGEVITALEQAKTAGKVRAIAYSGENEALAFAIQSGRFDSVQCSVNLIDQYALQQLLPAAREQGLGVIAKRCLANAIWTYPSLPARDDLAEYWPRWQAMSTLPLLAELPADEVALRFAAFAPGVSSAIIGTTKVSSLQRNLALLAKGPLPAAAQQQIHEYFHRLGQHWPGRV